LFLFVQGSAGAIEPSITLSASEAWYALYERVGEVRPCTTRLDSLLAETVRIACREGLLTKDSKLNSKRFRVAVRYRKLCLCCIYNEIHWVEQCATAAAPVARLIQNVSYRSQGFYLVHHGTASVAYNSYKHYTMIALMK
jgi:hypothetical protein